MGSLTTFCNPWRLSCDFVTAAKDSATLSPPTSRNEVRDSLQHPCLVKCLKRLTSSVRSPFLGMVLKGVKRWRRMWETPCRLGVPAILAAACSDRLPSAAAKCCPLRNFDMTGITVSASDSGPAAGPPNTNEQGYVSSWESTSGTGETDQLKKEKILQ